MPSTPRRLGGEGGVGGEGAFIFVLGTFLRLAKLGRVIIQIGVLHGRIKFP